MIYYRLRTKAHANKRAGRRNDPSPLHFRAEVTRGDDKCCRGGGWCWQQRYCALWAKPTCHRSRNLSPACSDIDPQPRRCTPAPWSSLKNPSGRRNWDRNNWNQVPLSLKSLCYCARNSAARKHSSPDDAGHFPWHAKCVKVCHIPSNPLYSQTGQGCREVKLSPGPTRSSAHFCAAVSSVCASLCLGTGESRAGRRMWFSGKLSMRTRLCTGGKRLGISNSGFM